MRLYRLTVATIFQRKSWIISLLAVALLPFALPLISSATENPILTQPARIQAAWATLWTCSLLWGLFTSANEGSNNTKSGIGEYFRTSGTTGGSQLLQIWLAVLSFVLPLAVITLLISHFGALPANPEEHDGWLRLNLQYGCLFLAAVAPLLGLATALSSRFGSITGFSACILLAIHGLYGVGYLDNMLRLEPNPLLRAVWTYSPHYRYADLTQRLYFKSGPLPTDAFVLMCLYFLGISAVIAVFSILIFRTRPKS